MRVASTSIAKKKARRRSGWWVALILLLAAAGGGAGWYFWMGPGAKTAGAASAKTGPDYHTTTVRQGSISLSAAGSGTYVPKATIDLSFSARGTVAELKVKLGDTVKAGQELARLGNTQALDAALASAQLQVLQNQKALDDLQQNSQVSLAQAYQALLKAQDGLSNAQDAALRSGGARCSSTTNESLNNKLALARERLDFQSISNTGTDAWLQAKANYDTALANYTYCTSHTDAEKASAQASLQLAQNALQQAQTTYDTFKTAAGIDPTALALAEANLKQAQTALTVAQQNEKGVTLVAPVDGKVIYLAAQQGAIVDTSTFITIADLSTPVVTVSIDQTDLSKLAVGSKAQVTFDALPNQTFNGTVSQVDPQMTKSGQYMVATGRVELDPAAAKALEGLPIGLNASITIVDKQANNVLIVPVTALRDLGGGSYAVFLVKNGKLLLTPVQVGVMDSVQAEISGAVKAGDVVSTGIVQSAGSSSSK